MIALFTAQFAYVFLLVSAMFADGHDHKCDVELETATLLDLYYHGDMGIAVSKISEAFRSMDINQDGVITRDEVKKYDFLEAKMTTGNPDNTISLGSVYKFADHTGDYQVTMSEFSESSTRLLKSEFKYCPSYCNKVNDKLQQCNVFTDESFKPYVAQATFSQQLCKLGDQKFASVNDCILKRGCGRLNLCFKPLFSQYAILNNQGVFLSGPHRHDRYDSSVPIASTSKGTELTVGADQVKKSAYNKFVGMVFADVFVPIGALVFTAFVFALLGAVPFLAFIASAGAAVGALIGMLILTRQVYASNVISINGPSPQILA
ncbi:hypothetical protein MIR68_004237 [Amoeboaphelidium protococcarum]|nr:hypothetical protein MIR68_004237 [Amoeboaphelidium protococcarum]